MVVARHWKKRGNGKMLVKGYKFSDCMVTILNNTVLIYLKIDEGRFEMFSPHTKEVIL